MPYSATDVRDQEKLARILLCGIPKCGKSVAAVMTSPKPCFVFNSDGRGALIPVQLLGGDFVAEDVTTYSGFMRGLVWLKSNMKQFYDPANGIRGTVIFDNITSYVGWITKEIKKRPEIKVDLQVYTPLYECVTDTLRALLDLPLHVVVISHIKNGEKIAGESTKMLSLPGNLATIVAALMNDWIGLDSGIEPNGLTKRTFLLAPQGTWNGAARSVQGVKKMNANISQFIELSKKQPVRLLKVVEPVAVEEIAVEGVVEGAVEGEVVEAAVEETAVEEVTSEAANEEAAVEEPPVVEKVKKWTAAPKVSNGSKRV